MRVCWWICCFLALVFSAAAAYAQGGGGGGTVIGLAGPQGISGAPFSADVIQESTQLLPDGNRIHQETHGKTYRDSQGRMRTEQQIMGMGGSERFQSIHIFDPIEQVWIILNPQDHTATIHHFGRPSSHPVPQLPTTEPKRQQPSLQVEPLGTKEIEGLTATGRRTIRTIEAGEVGNDKPLVSAFESWFSPELRTPLLSVTKDDRFGERTMRLVNIQRNEPDPALFQIPPDYQVKDQGLN